MSTNEEMAKEKQAHEFDKLFFAITKDVSDIIIKTTADSVGNILSVSNQFLSESTQQALNGFYELYSNSQNMDSQKQKIADDMENLFEEIKGQFERGETINVVEDEEKKRARLGLAALQKQLETLVTFEIGIREKLIPAVLSMQFEDVMHQRIQRLNNIWSIYLQCSVDKDMSLEKSLKLMKENVKSEIELHAFYSIVLEETPPAAIHSDNMWFENLLALPD